MVARVLELKILAQTDEARRQLDIINARADAIGRLDPTIKVRVDKTAVTQGLAVLNAETRRLAQDVTVKVTPDGVLTTTAQVKAATAALADNAAAIRAVAAMSGISEKKLAALADQAHKDGLALAELGTQTARGARLFQAYGQSLDPAGQAVVGLGIAAGVAEKQLASFASSAAATSSRFSAYTGPLNTLTFGWGRAAGGVQLYGGALTKIGVPAMFASLGAVHLLTQSVFELAATIIPAGIALGAFGAAAVPTVQDIVKQMQGLNTITHALGQNIYPLTGGFKAMADAVKPAVYTLFGEGLVLANAKTGQFTIIAKGAGKVLDDLGARFVVAMTSGKGFSQFLGGAVHDLAGWGTFIGNLGGIIGNLLKAMPGYAGVILNVLGSVTHALEMITASPVTQWVLHLGLAFHGAAIYIGLLGTAATALIRGGLGLIANLATGAGVKLLGLGTAGARAGEALGAFGKAANVASGLPWGWITLAAAGIGFLAYTLTRARDSADLFNASIQQTVQNSPLLQLNSTIMSGIAETSRKLAGASQELSRAWKDNTQVLAGRSGVLNSNQQALSAAGHAQSAYTAGLKQLGQESQLVGQFTGQLSKSFGGSTNALIAMNEAGITSAQVLNKANWAAIAVEVNAYTDALRAMGVTGQRSAAAANALGIQVKGLDNTFISTSLPAMQKVTQAEDALLNVVLGGRQAFLGFEQSIQGVSAKFKAPSGLIASAKLAGASLSGLNEQSLYLQNTFYNISVPAAQKVIGALQQQGIATKDLTTAIATEVGQMLPFTRGNIEARAVLMSLINNALGPGTVSLKTLNSWVKNNSGSLQGFNAIVAKSTIAAGSLANVLQRELTAQFQADLFASSGAKAEVKRFTDALTNSATTTSQLKGIRAQLITDLEKTGLSAQAAKQYVNNLQTQINNLHGKNVTVTLTGAAQGVLKATGQGVSSVLHFLSGFAAGGKITQGTGPTADDVLARVSKGETIVSAAHSRMLAGAFSAAGVPGYAAGGLVGDVKGMIPWTSSAEAQFGKSTMAAWAAAAAKQAITAAVGSLAGVSVGGGVQRWAGAAQQALALAGLGPSYVRQVLYQMQTESGGNPYAVNKTDSNWARGTPSVGLMQVIGPTFSMFAGQFRNTGPFAYGVSEAAVPNIYSAVKYAQAVYGPTMMSGGSGLGSGHGYDKGGLLLPGVTLAVNRTGRPEHVIPADAPPMKVTLEIRSSGHSDFDNFMTTWLKKNAVIKGGGSLEAAFGTAG